MKISVVIASVAMFLALPALAQPVPGIDQRQARQQARIQQGVATGELTPREAAKLEHGQQRVANMEARAKADGVVTPHEQARIQHAQNVQSKKIRHMKHNRHHRHA